MLHTTNMEVLALNEEVITIDTGSGGRKMHKLINDVILKNISSCQTSLEDSATIPKIDSDLSFTTDSFVVDPLFFPGGDIGKLCIYGTVNDLSVSGAKPLFLSLSFIIEEGFPLSEFERILKSIKEAKEFAGIEIVTGDTKVVPKGGCDKIFINTSGIGIKIYPKIISESNLSEGDVLIVSAPIGMHGAAIIAVRGEFNLYANIKSDLYPLNHYTIPIFERAFNISAMRDITRGGLATVLNEFSKASNCIISVNEKSIPISEDVKSLTDILGLDPLYFACEGTFLTAVSKDSGNELLSFMQNNLSLTHSEIIGKVTKKGEAGVYLKTEIGGERILSMLEGEQYPRIC